jgi:hypothetical protein
MKLLDTSFSQLFRKINKDNFANYRLAACNSTKIGTQISSEISVNIYEITRVAQKVMPHIFFLGNYLIRMYEIHAQYNWMFPLHMLLFHIISIYVYGLTPARNKGVHAFPVPAGFLFE